MTDNERRVALKYESFSCLGHTGEPDDYVIDIRIEVLGLSEDPRKVPDLVLGKGELSRVQVANAVNDRENLNFVFDASQELLNAGNAVYNSAYTNFKPSVLKQFPDAGWYEDFLLIRQLEIEPEYRGQRLGLAIVHRIMSNLGGGCGLIVGKPFPLEKSDNENIGRDKLRRYWEQVGWERIGKSDHWGLCPANKQKSAAELGLPDTVRLNGQPQKI